MAIGGDTALNWYLDLESRMCTCEARTGDVLALSGSMLAFRRGALRTLPSGVINDDLWIPLEIRRRNGRVGYEPACVASDVCSTTDVGEVLAACANLGREFGCCRPAVANSELGASRASLCPKTTSFGGHVVRSWGC